MKHYKELCGTLSLWHSETGSSVVEFTLDYEGDSERIVAIGKNDIEAMHAFIKAMADAGLVTPTIGGIIDEDF